MNAPVKFPFRYRRLGYVALNVSDVERSRRFYSELVGLAVSEAGEGPVALRCSRDHHCLLLYPSAQPGVKRVAFELESAADVDAARAHVEALGLAAENVDPAECRALRIGPAFRFRLPHCGLCVEYYSQMMHMALPCEPGVACIERLGHVVFNLQHLDQALAFVTGQLGFKVSDHVPGFAAFLRCHPNPLHHSMALLAGADDHLNHVNFMVRDIDDVGRAMNRMKKAGVEIVFGPGRHLPSESIFIYFLDPDGMTVEYSFGMEKFPEEGAREPRLLEPRPETLDTWGSLPAPAFGKTGCIEQAAGAAA
ncbi:MAG: VOC family protein [Nevskia sp.]|nr:VOC family protein [Nevskia sp.]